MDFDKTFANLQQAVPPELRFEPPMIGPERNGFLRLLLALREAPEGSRGLSAMVQESGGGTIDDLRVAVDRWKPTLQGAEEAVRVSTWSAWTGEAETQGGLQLQALIEALHFRAMLALADGRPAEAVRDYALAFRIAERLTQTEGPLVIWNVGVLLLNATNAVLRRQAWNAALDSKAVRELLLSLGPTEPKSAALVSSLKGQLTLFFAGQLAAMPDPDHYQENPANPEDVFNTLVPLVRPLLRDHPSPFDREDTLRLAAEIYGLAVFNAQNTWPRRKPLFEAALAISADWPPELLHLHEQPFSLPPSRSAELRRRLSTVQNPFGKLLVGVHANMLDDLLVRSPLLRADIEVTRLVLGLRLYNDAHGRLPAGLDELASGSLTYVPNDPFTERGFRYSAEHEVIWSAGPDGEDDSPVYDESIPFQWSIFAE